MPRVQRASRQPAGDRGQQRTGMACPRDKKTRGRVARKAGRPRPAHRQLRPGGVLDTDRSEWGAEPGVGPHRDQVRSHQVRTPRLQGLVQHRACCLQAEGGSRRGACRWETVLTPGGLGPDSGGTRGEGGTWLCGAGVGGDSSVPGSRASVPPLRPATARTSRPPGLSAGGAPVRGRDQSFLPRLVRPRPHPPACRPYQQLLREPPSPGFPRAGPQPQPTCSLPFPAFPWVRGQRLTG